MGIVAVLLAAVASYAWGSVWYMSMAKPWMAANGLTAESIDRKNPAPYIISFAATVLVAGMMRHILVMAGIDSVGAALVTGLGLGAFIAAPWIVTNYAFAGRPRALMAIDATYAVVGCAIIGLVLGLF
ncbi:DUF1761 family protein [Rhodobacteraceae bacterium 2CG4]|uniref:DUF1761 family protein n=1 Tax=Halovulum marinum TaxID=2662447 RepID=A0A6L5Z5A7_9RHOB|nr:DUF1761 domain-containing protein [Halovulum marinum]MSU91192.1 DUF1761 family protein [Halovulum marinum]